MFRTRKNLNGGQAAARKRDFARYLRSLSPLGYWRLGETSGNALDYSGNNRPGTMAGTGHTRATAGLLPLDGDKSITLSSTARVEVAYGSWQQTTAGFTVIACVTNTQTVGSMVGRRVSGSSPSTAQFSCRGGDMVVSNGSVETSLYGVYQPNSALPQMVAWTYDGTSKEAKFYSNGRKVWHIASGITVANGSTTPLSIGGLSGGSEYYTNPIDDAAYFGRVLTDAEVLRLSRLAGFNPVLGDATLATMYSTATLKIGLRSLGSYSGALVDVRRSADDATRTINTTSDGSLDTADLLSWSSGSSAVYVSKIYDQSGNGNHFTQATNSLQPRLVNSGTVENINGKPVMQFTSQNLDCVNATGGITDSNACTIFSAFDTVSVVRGRDGFGSGWSIQVCPQSSVSGCVRGGAYYAAGGANSPSSFTVKGYLHDGSASQAGHHGIAMQVRGVATSSSAFRSSTKGFNIGNSNGTFVNGKFGELIVWNTHAFMNEEVSSVVKDMEAYYGL